MGIGEPAQAILRSTSCIHANQRLMHGKCDAPQNFPIPADELIEKAKQLEAAFGGALDDSLLAPDFRFEFPVISLAREVG
jgi:hypothetical protein